MSPTANTVPRSCGGGPEVSSGPEAAGDLTDSAGDWVKAAGGWVGAARGWVGAAGGGVGAVGNQGEAAGDKVEIECGLGCDGTEGTGDAAVEGAEDTSIYLGTFVPKRSLGKKGLILRDFKREGVGHGLSNMRGGIW